VICGASREFSDFESCEEWSKFRNRSLQVDVSA